MSEAVLISIKPEWCELIASGEKTIEVRKTRPKLETPFKCYIYMTEGYASYPVTINGASYTCNNNGGKCVIGEFVCDKVATFHVFENGSVQDFFFKELKHSCLSYEKIAEYIGRDKAGYAWHISDLVIYNKSKELREFYSKCDKDCPNCEYGGYDIVNAEEFDMYCASAFYGHKTLKRPPPSWCYVEEVS